MSGGHWSYREFCLSDIIEDLNNLILKNGKLKTIEELKENLMYDLEYYEKYPEEKINIKYSKDIIKEFKKGLKIIKDSQIYIQRLDYLLSGDDGEESFLERLKEELNEKN